VAEVHPGALATGLYRKEEEETFNITISRFTVRRM
jgi:hypothetical protein